MCKSADDDVIETLKTQTEQGSGVRSQAGLMAASQLDLQCQVRRTEEVHGEGGNSKAQLCDERAGGVVQVFQVRHERLDEPEMRARGKLLIVALELDAHRLAERSG